MMKFMWSFFIGTVSIFSFSVFSPQSYIETDGIVKDMVLRDTTLVIGTDNGLVQVYDTKEKKFFKTIQLEPIKDFTGDMIPARVFSVDKYEASYLFLSDSGKGGYTNLWIHENNQTRPLITSENKYATIKARFIDNTHVLLGLLGNEAVLFDIINKKEIYRVQLSESKFSDFALSLDRHQSVFACESGILNVIDTSTGKVLHVLQGQNVDNVYKVDFKRGIVAAAGQDRRAALYDTVSGKGTYIQASFLIYATALSPSAKQVAFSMDEENNISIYDRVSKYKIAELQGQKSTLNTIIFQGEDRLFSSGDDRYIMLWKINQTGEIK